MRQLVDWIKGNRGVLARILMRYLAAALVSWGYVPEAVGAEIGGDPDLMILAGFVLAGAAEGGWLLAKRFGWAT